MGTGRNGWDTVETHGAAGGAAGSSGDLDEGAAAGLAVLAVRPSERERVESDVTTEDAVEKYVGVSGRGKDGG